MQSLRWSNGAWVLVLAVGLTAASYLMQKGFILIKEGKLPHRQQTGPLTLSESDGATKVGVQAVYSHLPLSFEANQGQADEQVHFLSRASGYALFLASTEAVLAVRKAITRQTRHRTAVSFTPAAPVPLGSPASPDTGLVLHLQLVGANPRPQVAGLEELPGKVNYFLGNNPEKWRINIPTYARVRYRDIYPGVDLVYYGDQHQLEYDFVVAPRGDPHTIRLSFQDQAGQALLPHIDAQGNLVVHATGGEVRLLTPRIYQERDSGRQLLSGHYVLFPHFDNPDSGSQIQDVGFEVAAYDSSKPLIIDPVLSYSTYLGGSSVDSGSSIAVDASGNAYITGLTYSPNFPLAFPLQGTISTDTGYVAFVTKLNATGSALVYSTYLGGKYGSNANAIAVDALGNAYMTGRTGPDFPLANPVQSIFGGGSFDAFATKLDATGSMLIYSTYLGGSTNADYGTGIAVDTAGNAYVTGSAGLHFPTTAGAFQAPCADVNGDAFVTKLNATGSAFLYSTCLGGSGPDFGSAIAVDSSGNAYVTGSTTSKHVPLATGFPTTPGAFQPDLSPSNSFPLRCFCDEAECHRFCTYLFDLSWWPW